MLRGTGHLREAYDHFNFSKGIRDWVEKHNRYSDEEARLGMDLRHQPLAGRELCPAIPWSGGAR